STDRKAEFARTMGADEIIYYRTESVVTRTRELTDGRGVDLILDHVGGPDFTTYLGALAPWGMIVSYNAFSGLPNKDLLGEMRAHMGVCPAVRVFSFHLYDNDRDSRRAIMRNLIAQLANGSIKPSISARLKLSEVRKAHALLESGSALGKIIMSP
ncbi:MAG: zinc-binding dehydrogenase, partial [Acidobacteriota bacterium]